MLDLFWGTDEHKKKIAREKYSAELFKEEPTLVSVICNDVSFDVNEIRSLIGARGLFGERFVIFLNGLFETASITEVLFPMLPDFTKSENYFIVTETTVKKDILTKFEKAKATVLAFDALKQKKTEAFNVFSLTDAFGSRDRKRAWALYREAIRNESDPREIHGIIFWAVKNMLLVTGEKIVSVKESGLSPFVHQKAIGAAKHFSKDELQKISSGLVSMYHDAQMGKIDFEEGLESFLLKVL